MAVAVGYIVGTSESSSLVGKTGSVMSGEADVGLKFDGWRTRGAAMKPSVTGVEAGKEPT